MDKLFENLKKGFNYAKNEAENLGKSLKNTTINMVDKTKLNLTLSDTEKKVKDVYAAIGESLYKDYTEGADIPDNFLEYCVEIDRFNKEIEVLREQISVLKNTVECPNCGQFNNKSGEYCSKCGHKIYADEETVVPDAVIEVIPDEE